MVDGVDKHQLRNFYIPEEQSFYLLNANDAKKMKDWVALCIDELGKLGYRQIELVGRGAYGFVFAGLDHHNSECVFKFSRINLAPHIQERLADEGFMLSQVEHPNVPKFHTYQMVGKQGILMMSRAKGMDLEQYSLRHGRLPVRLIIDIAVQLASLLKVLRSHQRNGVAAPLVHGDIKPSNIVYDPASGQISLVDWGSSVFAQTDQQGQYIAQDVMALMSADLQHSNARLGDVYFIGEEQRAGALSSPRFDEQGVAGTLYALASGQGCRFGRKAIPARSLGLPQEFATMLDSLLADDVNLRAQAGDYFLKVMPRLKHLCLPDLRLTDDRPLLPIGVDRQTRELDTVVYSSRKSFLREHSDEDGIQYVDDVQLERYYKNYLQGMGETEKAFIAAVSRLGRFPVVGGLAIHWQAQAVYVDCHFHLYNEKLSRAFSYAVNNVVHLARAIAKVGTFKACLFDARQTIHLARGAATDAFVVPSSLHIPYEIKDVGQTDSSSRAHSYFEDGKDPDEQLTLPDEIMAALAKLNLIKHTGCIIFEVTPLYMKIHSYFHLFDATAEASFRELLATIVKAIPSIQSEGVGGFMKLPHKDTRRFTHEFVKAALFYPVDPKRFTDPMGSQLKDDKQGVA